MLYRCVCGLYAISVIVVIFFFFKQKTAYEIVAALKTAFAGYESNDRGPLTALLADDFTFEMSDSMPYGGTYVGPEEFAAFWQEVGKEWRYFRYDAHEIIDAGDTILVPVKTDALSTRGITTRNQHPFLFKVKDGRLVF